MLRIVPCLHLTYWDPNLFDVCVSGLLRHLENVADLGVAARGWLSQLDAQETPASEAAVLRDFTGERTHQRVICACPVIPGRTLCSDHAGLGESSAGMPLREPVAKPFPY